MVVASLRTEDVSRAKELAEEFQFTYQEEIPQDYYLTFDEDRLVVKDPRQGPLFSLFIDIEKELKTLKLQKISPKKDLLAKAVGYKSQENYTIFDATLGMAKDSTHFLHLGCHVVASERDAVVFALVRDACNRASQKLPIQLLFGESPKNIIEFQGSVDCLYIDPMFEDVSKKSAPKKSMAFLRTRNDDLSSIAPMFHSAQEKSIKRIVVKRPLKGQQLYPEPNMSLNGKLVRYDIYLR